ncbi:uncharacterized protein BX663DRAFT_427413, partial [Cokeromyces recurvatus]|uniref:uncharacterized protein n=1 Tax=Cokeromyces recurvatus TaxID=90255 RepID=UPI00221EF9B7
ECNLSIKKLVCHPAARNARYEWVLKWKVMDINYLQNCVFINESAFVINMRPSYGRSAHGIPAVTTTPTIRDE